MIRRILRLVLGERAYSSLRNCLGIDEWRFRKQSSLTYDATRLFRYSGIRVKNRRTAISDIVIRYHVVEKGLTMPIRKFTFGTGIVKELIGLVNEFEQKYGANEPQVEHAVGVVKEYWDLHVNNDKVRSDEDFWSLVSSFVNAHKSVDVARQPHLSRAEFYKDRTSEFPAFALARHTLRHYSSKPLSVDRIRTAVEIATTTPSACNRQHCRVHCVSNKDLMEKLLTIQGGNRGFGHLADKLLIVTADMECIPEIREHNDLFTNGGMFLMNLCYALYYCEIAHCILNWSRTPEEDLEMRKLIPIKNSETVIAMLSCGETPDEFDMCLSPKNNVGDIFKVVS